MRLHIAVGRKATGTRPALVSRPIQPAALPDIAPFSFGELSPDRRAKLAQRYSFRFLTR